MVEAERTVPHNLEAERSVLAAILLENSAYERASPIVAASDFFRDAHRRIYGAIDRILEWRDGVADLVTLREELNKRGELDEVGGAAYISALFDGVARSSNVEHYARIVREKKQLRDLIAASNKILSLAYAGEESPEVILQQADRALVDLLAGNGSGRTVSLRDSGSALLADLEYRVQHRGELVGIDTGFASVNELLNGWQAGDLNVIGARPSIGKTTFVINSAVAGAAKAGKRTAVFSLEMRRKQLEYRMLSSLSGVPLSRILSGCLMAPDWAPVSAAVGVMNELPIYVNDRAGMSIGDIRTECRRLKSEEGALDLVIIDYVQLMDGMLEKRSTRNEQIGDTSKRCKHLADELGVSIVLLSQLSRANEKRPDPRPKLSDLRESGALEQDADNVCFLHRRNHREGGLTYFIAEKQRNGPTGTLKLSLDRDIVTFTDAPDLAEPVPERKAIKKGEAPKETDRYLTDS